MTPQMLDSEMVTMWDCDDTLVMWDCFYHDSNIAGDVYVPDPYDIIPNAKILLRRNEAHIKLLKDHKARGYTVIVWSAGGCKWAKSVVESLELNDYVDLIMSKPVKFIDDMPAERVLVNRVYLKGPLDKDKDME